MKVRVMFADSEMRPGAKVGIASLISVKAPRATASRKPIHRVIAADCSGSMGDQHGETTKIAALREAISGVVEAGESARIGLVGFSDKAWEVTDRLKPGSALDLLRPQESTNMWAGIEVAHEMDPDASLILISDGMANNGEYCGDGLVEQCVGIGVPIHAIGLGKHADMGLLSEIARRTGGFFGISATDIDLQNVITACCYDGKKRYSAKLTARAARGVTLSLDCEDPDWHVSEKRAWVRLRDIWPSQERILRLVWTVGHASPGERKLGTVDVGDKPIAVNMRFGENRVRNQTSRPFFDQFRSAEAFLSGGVNWGGTTPCILGTGMHAPASGPPEAIAIQDSP